MEVLCVKLEETFAQTIEQVMQQHHYMTKTEFVREAIRDKLVALEQMQRVMQQYGAARRKTTNKQLHDAGRKAFNALWNARRQR